MEQDFCENFCVIVTAVHGFAFFSDQEMMNEWCSYFSGLNDLKLFTLYKLVDKFVLDH